MRAHKHSPLHWARMWSTEKGYFTKADYTSVSPAGDVIQLGHNGDECPRPVGYTDAMFTIVHVNGIHSSKIRFCECAGPCDKVEQLMNSHLFPGTPKDPKTAFTFEVLKTFNLLNLQSKCGAYDYMLTLRQLTDNVYTATVPVSLFSRPV